MNKGDLIWWRARGFNLGAWYRGIVIDYRPQVLGGSWSQSYKEDGIWKNEFMSEPARGECLVRLLDADACFWVDEKSLLSPEAYEIVSTQGAR